MHLISSDHRIYHLSSIRGKDNLRSLALGCLRKQLFPEAFTRLPDNRVTGVEDGLGRTIILLESDDARRRGELLREIQDIPHRGSAERVDRLRVVPDHG